MVNRPLIVSLGLLVLGTTLFIGNSLRADVAQPADLPTLRLALNTWVGYGPLYLAQEKGFFAEEGVDVVLLPIEDVAQKKAVLKSGRVDALAETLDSLVLYANEDVPATAIAQLDLSSGADGIVAVESIRSIAELKGKTIAVQKNFVSEAFLNYLLIEEGMSPSDVHTVDMEGGAAGAAFVSGSVDAAVTFEPWLSKAKERAGGKILVSSKEYSDIIVDILMVHPAYAQENRDAVLALLRGWFKAVAFAKENPTEANAIMAAQYKVSPEEFAGFLEGLQWSTFEENLDYFASGRVREVTNVFSDVFLKTGQINTAPPMEQHFDASFLQEIDAQ